ncbi:MAG: redoxin domain-containing protein [Nitrospirae bacterium]|nr:redoxin domain-containing protein [Nitrospirota bacterium]MBI3392428.1 redoxin domain-containing protein [Nitrospirota bacterium]
MRRFNIAVLGLVLFSLFSVEAGAAPLAVGSKAPDFKATDHDGRSATLSGLRHGQKLVLVFYRGEF